jgi:flavin reductase (DIM6/NTAB) family NADH-FMN oxidoreductase RutF
MHCDVRKPRSHGLLHDPFKAIVAPRPIGWITSTSAAGEIGLAPCSLVQRRVERAGRW